MELILSICLGIGLSAACGFRIFIPLLAMSIAGLSGHLELSPGFQWIATWAAFSTFAVATTLEIGAYYIPFLDNLLDTAAAPTATVAGAVVSASCITDVSPMLQWTLAAITGGGVAAVTQVATTKLRMVSSSTTGGFGNPVLATAEAGGSIFMSVLALLFPVLAAVGAVALVAALFWLASRIARGLARFASNFLGRSGSEPPAPPRA